MSAESVQPEAQSQPQPRAGDDRQPSPSTLAYLFANRFVLREKPGKTGMVAYGTGEVVVTSELAGGLVAIALWQLREMGAVSLEAYSTKKFGLIPDQGVRVRLVGDATLSGGVEKAVLDFLRRSKKAHDGGERAWDIANILAMEGKNARLAVIKLAIDEAVDLGYLHREKTEAGVIGRLAGRPANTLQPDADRIATLAPAAERLAIAWRDFRQGEVDLAKQLRSTTFEGIEARMRSRDRDDD